MWWFKRETKSLKVSPTTLLMYANYQLCPWVSLHELTVCHSCFWFIFNIVKSWWPQRLAGQTNAHTAYGYYFTLTFKSWVKNELRFYRFLFVWMFLKSHTRGLSLIAKNTHTVFLSDSFVLFFSVVCVFTFKFSLFWMSSLVSVTRQHANTSFEVKKKKDLNLEFDQRGFDLLEICKQTVFSGEFLVAICCPLKLFVYRIFLYFHFCLLSCHAVSYQNKHNSFLFILQV